MVMQRMLSLGFALAAALATQDVLAEVSEREVGAMKIRVNIEGKTLTATLADNQTSRDFVSLLPLTLKLEDYASTEKISYLPRKLSTADAPAGSDPSVGDITYYAPWGNLALFYRDFGYSKGLIRLGSFDQGVDTLRGSKDLTATIELLQQ